MHEASRRLSLWPTLVRAGGLLVCLVVFQQCNRPPEGTIGPTGPTIPSGQTPPDVSNIPSTQPSTPQVFVGAGDIAICGAGPSARTNRAA